MRHPKLGIVAKRRRKRLRAISGEIFWVPRMISFTLVIDRPITRAEIYLRPAALGQQLANHVARVFRLPLFYI